eukprot:g2208.t1
MKKKRQCPPILDDIKRKKKKVKGKKKKKIAKRKTSAVEEVVFSGPAWELEQKDEDELTPTTSRYGSNQGSKKKQVGSGDATNPIFSMRTAFEEITDLGATQLKSYEKRAWANRKLVERGSKANKERNIPIKILQGILKKRKRKEREQSEQRKESGVVIGRGDGPRNDKRKKTPRSRANDNNSESFRHGVLYLGRQRKTKSNHKKRKNGYNKR